MADRDKFGNDCCRASVRKVNCLEIRDCWSRAPTERKNEPLVVGAGRCRCESTLTTTRGGAQPTRARAATTLIWYESTATGTTPRFLGLESQSLARAQQPLESRPVAVRRYYAASATQGHCPFAVRPRLQMHDVVDVDDRRAADPDDSSRIELARH